jgi:hypothetical protein
MIVQNVVWMTEEYIILCGNFLKNGHLDRGGWAEEKHLRATGCEDVKWFRTVHRVFTVKSH